MNISPSRTFPFALILLLSLIFSARLSHPWTYNDDYNGAFWSQAARNFSQAGFLSSAGVPAPLYFVPPPIPESSFYVHHPALFPALMFIDRSLLGESEAAARALPILFSLLAALLLWAFVRVASGPRMALFALAFFIAAPMELHYGPMPNFEAPELAFLLAALCSFHLWRLRPTLGRASSLVLFSVLALWTDWIAYLMVLILVSELLLMRRGHAGLALALIVSAFLSGAGFLLQIHAASPGAWRELLGAFRQRSSQANLSGGSFTALQWLGVQRDDLLTLFHPVSWMLAAAGAFLAIRARRGLSPLQSAPFHIAAVFFIIDAFYICALPNQSYIHDFASFYFLIPVAIFSAFTIESLLSRIGPGPWRAASTCTAALLVAFLIFSGVRSLGSIDTQFLILNTPDGAEPPNLMPDLGRLADRTFPPGAVVLCNFDQYCSPLPYYARRPFMTFLRTYPEWLEARSDAAPQPVAGLIWTGDSAAAELLRHLPPSETRKLSVDGIPFALWLPAPAH